MGLLKDVHPMIAEILDGKHDDLLSAFEQATSARRKAMLTTTGLRKNALVVVAEGSGGGIGGRTGIIRSVNKKTASVDLDCLACGSHDEREWDFQPVGNGVEEGTPPADLCKTCYGTPEGFRIPLPWLSVKPTDGPTPVAGDGSTLGTALAGARS